MDDAIRGSLEEVAADLLQRARALREEGLEHAWLSELEEAGARVLERLYRAPDALPEGFGDRR
jgi:hypothetical protein